MKTALNNRKKELCEQINELVHVFQRETGLTVREIVFANVCGMNSSHINEIKCGIDGDD